MFHNLPSYFALLQAVTVSVQWTAVAGAGMLQDGWKQKCTSFLMGSVTSLRHPTLLTM